MREFDGKVRLVVRYMPLHGNSAYASGLLEGARAQGRYWDLLDVFYDRQPEWASHHAPRPDLLVGYVGALGLDVRAMEAAARDPETVRRIRQDHADGVAFRVGGTPTFFVNGHMQMHLGHAPLRQAVIQALGSR
jgi:protein-disulfide isomerase